jgi:23S rRNA (uracil1939-C5)-methyltransferase
VPATPLEAKLTAALAAVGETHRLPRITRHGELVLQRATPTLRMGRATVALPPGAFLQATEEGEATLARLVLGHVGKAKAVADLFSLSSPIRATSVRWEPALRHPVLRLTPWQCLRCRCRRP